jgi:hypothetical protein
MTQLFILSHAEARKRAAEAVLKAPDGHCVRVGESTRNLDQNARLHALLTEIAESREWAGRKWDVDTWKRLLTGAWLRTRNESPQMLPAIDGHGVEVIYQRTSQLTKRECSELMEFIEAWQHDAT